MTINKPILGLLATVLLYLLTVNANAHDPGLSLLEISLLEQQSVAKLTFARQDLETLYSVDSDQNGQLTDHELATAQTALIAVASNSITLWSDGAQLIPRAVNIRRAESDAIHLTLTFARLNNDSFILKSPGLLQLPRGHRQYVSVLNAANQTLSEHMLSRADYEKEIRLQKRTVTAIFVNFLMEGIRHIWIGLDHILFLVTLILPAVLLYQAGQWRPARSLYAPLMDTLKIVTAFTAAHSITLSLAALQIITPPTQWVESAIAVTVILAALNNLRPLFSNSRWLLAFVFGLIHGFGFAGVLADIGLQQELLATSLLAFNLGVEIGQAAIVGLLFPVIYVIRHSRLYPLYVLKGGSLAAIIIAIGWLGERLFDVQLMVM